MSDEPLIAVFVDFENLAIGVRHMKSGAFQIQLILKRLLEKGRIVHKRAYCDWSNYRAFYAGSDNPALRCADLAARLATGAIDAAWDNDALALWHGGNPLPADCDAPFAALASRNKLTPELRWQRLELAADAGNSAVMRIAARGGFTPNDDVLATDYATFIDLPSDTALRWPKSDRSRRIAAAGAA